jgi:hypothetical protein
MSTLKELMGEIKSPEYKQKLIEEHQKYLDKVSMDYQLGYYVGEHIVSRYLPTLSTDMVQSRNVIKVSEEHQSEYDEMDKDYVDTLIANDWKKGDDNLFEMLKKFRKLLDKEYLPNPLDCHLRLIKYNDEKEFKEGLRSSLWDCDMCSYNIEIENIKIENEMEMGFTIITFQLDENLS